MKSFKNWFNENFDNVFMHPNRKRAVSVLDSSNGLDYKTKNPPIESLPEGVTEISNPHITLIDPSEMQEFKKKIKELLEKDYTELQDLPKPVFGKQVVITRHNGDQFVVADISNQEDFHNYVSKIWRKLEVPNKERKYFYMTLANNSNGDPLVLTGNITERDFEEKHEF